MELKRGTMERDGDERHLQQLIFIAMIHPSTEEFVFVRSTGHIAREDICVTLQLSYFRYSRVVLHVPMLPTASDQEG
jgi:hypothetical protein